MASQHPRVEPLQNNGSCVEGRNRPKRKYSPRELTKKKSNRKPWNLSSCKKPSSNFVPKSKMTTEDKKIKLLKTQNLKELNAFQICCFVTTDLAKTKSLDEALETLVKITTSTIGAERGTIFLNDASTGELYSRIAQGNFRREIRILNSKGVAGWAFTKNQGVIIHDAYKDERFNKAMDVRTGSERKVFYVHH